MIFGHWYVLVILLVLVLIVFGPGRLPEVGGAIGKAMNEFRKASTDIQDDIKRSVSQDKPAAPPSSPEQPAADVKPTDTKAS
jgi:sec-independent protein translocase protein TatA